MRRLVLVLVLAGWLLLPAAAQGGAQEEPPPRTLVSLTQDCVRCVRPLHPLRIHVETNGAAHSYGRGQPMHYYPLEPAQLQKLRQIMARPEWRTMSSQPTDLDETRIDVAAADWEVVGARGAIVQELFDLLLTWDRQNHQPEKPSPIIRRFSRCDNCFVGIYQDVSVLQEGRVRFRAFGRLAVSPRATAAQLQQLRKLVSDPRWQELPLHQVGKYDEQETFLEAGGRRVSSFSDPLVIEVVKVLDEIEKAAAPPRWF